MQKRDRTATPPCGAPTSACAGASALRHKFAREHWIRMGRSSREDDRTNGMPNERANRASSTNSGKANRASAVQSDRSRPDTSRSGSPRGCARGRRDNIVLSTVGPSGIPVAWQYPPYVTNLIKSIDGRPQMIPIRLDAPSMGASGQGKRGPTRHSLVCTCASPRRMGSIKNSCGPRPHILYHEHSTLVPSALRKPVPT